MRILLSFILSFIIYASILGFFLFVILNKKDEKKEVVYIHQAILIKKSPKKMKKQIPKQVVKKETKETIKKVEKKPIIKPKQTVTKDTFSKGGKENIKFDDIFSNINEKIPTTKIKQKKQNQMTKKVNKNLKAVEALKKQIQSTIQVTNTTGDKNDIDYIQNELAKVWNSINTNDGDFVRVEINVENNNLNFNIISTNLDTIRLNQFINKLKNIDVKKLKNLNTTIDFKSKLKE